MSTPLTRIPLISMPHPWQERFDKTFFKSIPIDAGVYFFHNDKGLLLYVGKAKNLRNRLRSYRNQNVDEAPRKLKRLLHRTHKITWETVENEKAALLKENFLLRTLKPMFNRLNTRPEFYVFLKLRHEDAKIFFTIHDDIERALPLKKGQSIYGAFSGRSTLRIFLASFLSLHWLAQNPDRDFWSLPYPLNRDEVFGEQSLGFAREDVADLKKFLLAKNSEYLPKLLEKLLLRPNLDSFLTGQIQNDLTFVKEFHDRTLTKLKNMRKVGGLKGSRSPIPQDQVDDLKVELNFPERHSKDPSLRQNPGITQR